MERIVLCLVAGLLCIWGTSAQQNASFAFVSSSGSGSGVASGSAAASCDSFGCSHNCTELPMGPECRCPTGMLLGDDLKTCEECPGGRWGYECSENCSCGQGNPCDAVTGMCICNSCWEDSSCDRAVGTACFSEFLEIPEKIVEPLNRRYGGYTIPLPPRDTETSLVADYLMEVTATVVRDVNLQIVNRTEVNQGPVAKLTWTVDYTANRPQAELGLSNLENKVKIGTVRATLVIQSLTDTAEVTLNAGTSIIM